MLVLQLLNGKEIFLDVMLKYNVDFSSSGYKRDVLRKDKGCISK